MTLYEFLVIAHIIGTVLGVGAATFTEIFHTKFGSDDIITDDEKKTLSITYTVMRVGLLLLVLSGFGFLLYLRMMEQSDVLMNPVFWAKMTVVLVLVANAILLQARMMPFAVGAAISLTSWYTALVLGVVRPSGVSYMDIIIYYIGATIVVGMCLKWIRARVHIPKNI